MNDTTAITSRLAEGTLIRGAWTGTDGHGRATACLLAALVPKCGETSSAAACPAEVMPAWLAYMTPWIDDSGTLKHWPDVIRRYANLASRWHVLDDVAWRKCDYAVRAMCVREALSHVTEDKWGVRLACEGVLALLDEVATTGKPIAWAAAVAAAARAAAVAAAARAARAAWAAAEAAEAAARAAWAAAEAAEAAARAAWAAAEAAEAAARAAWAAAVADRIIDATMDILERAIVSGEASA